MQTHTQKEKSPVLGNQLKEATYSHKFPWWAPHLHRCWYDSLV